MLLRRFIDFRGLLSRYLMFAALAALLSGCAGGGGTSTRPVAEANVDTDVIREVPPKAQTMFEQAVAVMAGGDLVEAEFRFQEFVLQYPDYPGAYTNLAIIHAENGNDEAAEGAITDALIIDPAHAPTLNQLGMLLRRQGKFTDAEAAYQRAIESRPDYALAHYNLGVLNELYLRRLDSALLHFEEYQALTGDDEQVGKWIADLKRRLAASQRTANVTE